jgi:flagellar motor protein MotB
MGFNISLVLITTNPTGARDNCGDGTRTLLKLPPVLYFHEDQIELDDRQRLLLRQLADGLRGRRQQLEIRGQTSNRPAIGTNVRDHWDLSFERCRRVMTYLVDEQQVDPRELRISAASAKEPLNVDTDLQMDARVDVLLLN